MESDARIPQDSGTHERRLPLAERWAAQAGRIATGMPIQPKLSILIFHRVLPQQDTLFPTEMHAGLFERLMKIVARSFKVLPLKQAVRQLAQGELPRRALSITFDDGYANNLTVALPILRRLGLSSTVFVASGFLDGGRMFNDSIIECLRRTTADRVDLGEFGLEVMPTVSAAERRLVIERLLPIIKYRPPEERERMVRRLCSLCGNPVLPDDLMMRTEDVRSILRGGMDVGAHTVSHPILCTLPDDMAEEELVGSKSQLESILDAPVPLFAYPNGRPGKDYDERHVRMARRTGFTASVTTEGGAARAGDDLFQLPRYTPWEPQPLRWTARLVSHHLRA